MVDGTGHPVARVAITIKSRARTRSALERYQLIQAEGMGTWRAGTFQTEVGRAGWYRVRLHADPDEERVTGYADVYVDGKQPEPTIVYRGKVITCSLHDAAGRQLRLSAGYSMTIRRGCRSTGMGVIFGGLSRGPGYPDLRFPWPHKARSITVTLNGRSGLSGSIQLDSPEAPCRIQARTPR